MPSFADIDVSGIKVDNLVNLPKGRGVLIKLAQKDGRKIVFQTPLMPLAWNTQVRVQEEDGKTSCQLPLSFGTASASVTEFKEWLNGVREHLKAMVTQNAMEWCGKNVSLDLAEDYVRQVVSIPKPDSSYSPNYLPKMDHSGSEDGAFSIDVKVFHLDKSLGDANSELQKGARVSAIVEMPYMHFSKSNMKFTLRNDVKQIMVIPVLDEAECGFDFGLDKELESARDAIVKETEAVVGNKRDATDESGTSSKKVKTAGVTADGFNMAEFDEHDDV